MAGKRAIGSRTYILGSACYLAIAVFVFCLRVGGGEGRRVFWDIYPLFGQIAAAICAFYAAWQLRSRATWAAWGCFGSAFLLHTVADIFWAYDELCLGIDPTKAASPGVFACFSYLCFGVGMLLLFKASHPVRRIRILLDCLIVTGSAGLVAWDVLYQTVCSQSPLATTHRVVALSYPLADLVIVTFALFLLWCRQCDRRQSPVAATLLLAAVAVACADFGFAYNLLLGRFETGQWIELFWLLGIASAGSAALQAAAVCGGAVKSPSAAKPVSSLWETAGTTGLALTVSASVIGSGFALRGGPSMSSLFASFILLGLVALRQMVQVLDQRTATEEELRAFNDQLEHTVAHRTRQLEGMLRLTSAVNATLDLSQVLSEALREIRESIGCDAAAIWVAEKGRAFLAQDGLPWSHTYGDAERILNTHKRLELDRAKTVDVGAQHAGFRVLVAPLLHGGEVGGWVALSRNGGGFESAEMELLEAMGLLIGPAIHNAVSYHGMAYRVNLDPVTGLYNHRSIHQQLDAMFTHARQAGRELTILMMDLQNFKLFNAAYGHQEGDKVLEAVASVIVRMCPANGVVGRFGGDEFVAVLPDTGAVEAVALAARINDGLAASSLRLSDDDRTIPLSVCAGVAAFPADGSSYEELLTSAATNLTSARIGAQEVACTSEAQRAARLLREDPTYATLDMLIAAVDNKDAYTRRHSEEVAEYALRTARELGCAEHLLKEIQTAGLLHDVGKIGVPREILAKPARLTPEETAVINRHAWLGAMIISAFSGLEELAEVVRGHHERWDGRGYPDGLAGEDIPWVARLLAVADTFSAMTSDRPYRQALSTEDALEEIAKHAGTQFDPALAEAFIKSARRRLPKREAAKRKAA